MQTEWTQRENDTDTWVRNVDPDSYCYVSNYAGSDRYCWQARRGSRCLSAIVTGRETAMAAADDTMALPEDDYNARILSELVSKLREVERNIAAISPTADILPGYHAGYEAGVAAMKRKIEAVMEAEPC